jgi:hypothetical protein
MWYVFHTGIIRLQEEVMDYDEALKPTARELLEKMAFKDAIQYEEDVKLVMRELRAKHRPPTKNTKKEYLPFSALKDGTVFWLNVRSKSHIPGQYVVVCNDADAGEITVKARTDDKHRLTLPYSNYKVSWFPVAV